MHQRSEGTLMRELSRIVTYGVQDPRASAVRVSKVELSPDKRHARVLVAFWDPATATDEGDAPLYALRQATSYIRKTLAKNLRMRHVPELRWSYDLSDHHAKRIDTLLKRIEKRARKKKRPPPGLACVAAALALASASASPMPERLESTASIMGSEFRIACYAESKKLAAGAITAAFDEARRVDRLLSNYRPDSELSHVNEGAADAPVRVSRELADLLVRCQRYSEASDGAFDITVGALVKAWGFHGGDGHWPSAWALWRARRNVGYQHLLLDLERREVRFERSGLQLDPGGIGKGYAVDRAVSVLRGYGISSALVSSGTSSIFAMGSPPAERTGWSLDIRGAESSARSAISVTLRDKGMSTSGSYEKYFERAGDRYGHILDPRTGRPARGLVAVSVVASTATDAEAWSTALLVNGSDWARQHKSPEMRVLACPEGGPCQWLDRD
ncbi:MAG: 30S ribosome-binding factor RbfA [Bryobacterales bacterium]|nr:30S ribosome-binding factor RbfA [Bryobacterales bacterium]